MNIVLIHGILGFSHIDVPLQPLDYFAGIAGHLRAKFKAKVMAPTLDPTEGTKARSGMLRTSIRGALQSGELDPSEPVHIIAHSLGGLDARRMISENPNIDTGAIKVPVKTLVTISTPHRGTPVADVLALDFLPRIPLITPVLNISQVTLANVLAHFRISLNGLRDLTSQSAVLFEKECPDQPTVRYMSFAGKGRPHLPHTSLFFLPYYEFIKLRSGGADSDGVVPVSSAKHGEFDENLWPGDHADEIGHNLDFPLGEPPEDVRRRFDAIVLSCREIS